MAKNGAHSPTFAYVIQVVAVHFDQDLTRPMGPLIVVQDVRESLKLVYTSRVRHDRRLVDRRLADYADRDSNLQPSTSILSSSTRSPFSVTMLMI